MRHTLGVDMLYIYTYTDYYDGYVCMCESECVFWRNIRNETRQKYIFSPIFRFGTPNKSKWQSCLLPKYLRATSRQ